MDLHSAFFSVTLERDLGVPLHKKPELVTPRGITLQMCGERSERTKNRILEPTKLGNEKNVGRPAWSTSPSPVRRSTPMELGLHFSFSRSINVRPLRGRGSRSSVFSSVWGCTFVVLVDSLSKIELRRSSTVFSDSHSQMRVLSSKDTIPTQGAIPAA